MITNPQIIPDKKKFKCNKLVGKWLIYQKHLPVFSIDGDYYIFARTAEFEKAIKELPLYLKIVKGF